MKLRNKKTGKIGNFCYGYTNELCVSWQKDDGFWGKQEYKYLAELNEEWEDYEDPKDDYIRVIESFINYVEEADDSFCCDETVQKFAEKLKAWKRLKDKGLTFCAWKITDDGCSVDVETTLDAEIVRAKQKYITDDLDLLFGGEE